ncbi:MAG: outer membrane beta-barrel protein [Burkholderiales bacterium]|nr:outer membrane beta-barrel protein [Burkholderiales bacterium]
MDTPFRWLAVLGLAAMPAAMAAPGDYVGTLRPTAKPLAIAIPDRGLYWPAADAFGTSPAEPALTEGFKLKLGYRYSRYLAVETGYASFGSLSGGPNFGAMATPRGRGFSMDTIGTLPLWRHTAVYGRFGAWYSGAGVSLLGATDPTLRSGSGLRYGLGVKYDLTRSVGLQAELERFAPIDRWGPREGESDQFTLGVRWRF